LLNFQFIWETILAIYIYPTSINVYKLLYVHVSDATMCVKSRSKLVALCLWCSLFWHQWMELRWHYRADNYLYKTNYKSRQSESQQTTDFVNFINLIHKILALKMSPPFIFTSLRLKEVLVLCFDYRVENIILRYPQTEKRTFFSNKKLNVLFSLQNSKIRDKKSAQILQWKLFLFCVCNFYFFCI
jgi:hypothetical protein